MVLRARQQAVEVRDDLARLRFRVVAMLRGVADDAGRARDDQRPRALGKEKGAGYEPGPSGQYTLTSCRSHA
jgi:hypothetical protein